MSCQSSGKTPPDEVFSQSFTNSNLPVTGIHFLASTIGPRRVRLDGNRPRTHPSPKPPRKPARKPSASKSGPRGRDLHNPLTDISRRLEVISAVAVTAEVALRAQNCEQDADIAL